MRGRIAAGIIVVSLIGCAGPSSWTNDAAPPGAAAVSPTAANPAFLPITDSQCAWETVVSVVAAYFRIEREEPIHQVGNMLTEGRITTVAEISPTVFEPWRRDTVDPEQRVENTLQSMRRRAVVRVIPTQGGHLVDVQVFKELENVVRPEHATAGAATFSYDVSLNRIENPVVGEQINQGWIPRGRDTSMEQYMIGDLLSRCGPGAVRR